MGNPVLKVVFTEKPQQIKAHTETEETLSVMEMLAMNRRRIARDLCLISTSSDNMHHI